MKWQNIVTFLSKNDKIKDCFIRLIEITTNAKLYIRKSHGDNTQIWTSQRTNRRNTNAIRINDLAAKPSVRKFIQKSLEVSRNTESIVNTTI